MLDNDAIRPVYQPVVRLDSGRVVGFEALARGPEDSPLHTPDKLFQAARDAGRLEELDWACKTAAIRGAIQQKLRPPLALFVNSEPDSGSNMPVEFAESWAFAKKVFLRLFFEITERAVTAHPAELLRRVRDFRSFGWGVALDDVGAEPGSIAMLPYLEPDVIKLDMSLVQNADWASAEAVLAVNAEAERAGSMILAEGIETRAHLELANAFGADLAQGWYFGRPGRLPADITPGPAITIRPHDDAEDSFRTPFDYVHGRIKTRVVGVEHLRGASRLLEERATKLPHPPLLVAAFQEARRFRGPTKATYERLAEQLPFVALLGHGMPPVPAAGIRGVPLEDDDPLRLEWSVACVSPYSGMLLAAREIEPEAGARRFEAGVTFDRDIAIRAASYLIKRIVRPDGDEGSDSAAVHFATAVADALAESKSTEELARPLLRALADLTGLHSTFLSRVSDDVYDVTVSYNAGDLEVAEGLRIPWSESVCRYALEVDRQTFEDVQSQLPEATLAREMGFRGFVTCPIVVEDGRVIGTLCGATTEVREITTPQLEMVRSFARLIAMHVHSARNDPAATSGAPGESTGRR